MSPIRAVVPVKAIGLAKRRLSGLLAAAVRRELALAMLEDVLAALVQVRALAGILVVTADRDAAALAARYGAARSDEATRDGHSAAVGAAARRLAQAGEGMLTLPADVPLVTPGDVEAILALGPAEGGAGFVIVPAYDGRGSNAVLCVPADAVRLRFGGASYRPHLAQARAAGLRPATLRLPRVALDIDGPAEVTRLMRMRSSTRARAVLARHGIGMVG